MSDEEIQLKLTGKVGSLIELPTSVKIKKKHE